MPDASRRAFPNTNWTLVQRLRSTDEGQRRAALEELCHHYWPPIYTFARSLGHSPHDAEDLVQSFLTGLLAREGLHSVAPDRGQLRTFLKTAFRHHAVDAARTASREKRGGGATHFALDVASAEREFTAHPGEAPDANFDRQWVRTLLMRCLAHLRERYATRGKSALFTELEPLLSGDAADPGPQIAARLGLSDMALRAALKRLREHFREILRSEVANTLAEGEDVDTELRWLLSLSQ
jgi:RNA polymerase sigma-70 factor (ECF subfamily)